MYVNVEKRFQYLSILLDYTAVLAKQIKRWDLSKMNIQILCPQCQSVLSDKFSAPSCKLSTCYKMGYDLMMECTSCELHIGVTIKLETYYKQSSNEV